MKLQLMAEAWNYYARKVVPGNAGPEQRRQTRLAFYSGAWAFYLSTMKLLDPGTEPTADDLERMDALVQELEEFKNAMAAERMAAERGGKVQ